MLNNSFLKYKNAFVKRCQTFSNKVAITFMRDSGEITKTSFGQMMNGCEYIDSILSDCKIVSGDRVAIISPHSPQSVLVALGLAYSNVTSVLIDASLPSSEINRLLSFSDVQGCFITKNLYHSIDIDIKNTIPFFELCSKENEYKLFDDSVSTTQKDKTPDPEKDVIAILFSSGTTALMKGVKVTYESVIKSSDIFIRNVEWKPEYSYLHVFPLNHIAGYATVQAFLSCGSELGMIENMNATKLQEALLNYQPHGFGMIPKVFEMMEDKTRLKLKQKGFIAEKSVLCLMSISSFLRRNFGCMIGRKWLNFITKQIFGNNIVAIGTGASLCRPSTSKFFLDLGLYWTNNYASTETNVPAASTGNFDRYPVGIAGYAKRNPEIDIKINNPDVNGIGEIYIKSQLLMKGYFRDDELTKSSYDGDYFKTGDYGYIDKKGNLYVTGRVKESIILHTGKKVSPTDIENYYKSACGDIPFACCGNSQKDSNYDEVHLFVQTKGFSEKEINESVDKIYALSNQTANLYRLSAVHKIEKIPMTSVGKVKRFELQKRIKDESSDSVTTNNFENSDYQNKSVESVVVELLKQSLPVNSEIALENNVQYLGLDSLNVLELDVKIQNIYGISIVGDWLKFKTVADLANHIKSNIHKANAIETVKYPIPKTQEDINKLKTIISQFEEFCEFEFIGLENIPETPCVFTPNHCSHLDTIAVYNAITTKNEERIYKMCCLAAKELENDSQVGPLFKSIGAISVDRKVNSAATLNIIQKAISDEGYSVLIYPEGTRSRSGKMNAFLDGAAIICSKTNTPAVPVYIKGTFEVWPPQFENPKILPQKQKITVIFGKAIFSKNKNVKQLTEIIENSVNKLKGDL